MCEYAFFLSWILGYDVCVAINNDNNNKTTKKLLAAAEVTQIKFTTFFCSVFHLTSNCLYHLSQFWLKNLLFSCEFEK